MLVDTVAMSQGIINAYEDKKIPQEVYHTLMLRIQTISRQSKNTRRICNYAELLSAISEIEIERDALSSLWEYLGHSLSSGISVARGNS
jgi:hypothetical protein